MKKIILLLIFLLGCNLFTDNKGAPYGDSGDNNNSPAPVDKSCYTDEPNSILNLWHNDSEDMTLDFRDGMMGVVDYYGVPLKIKFTFYPHANIQLLNYGRDITGLSVFNKYTCEYLYEIITVFPNSAGFPGSTATQGFFRIGLDSSPDEPLSNVCLEMIGVNLAGGGYGYNYYNWHTYTVTNKKLSVRFFEGVSVNHPPLDFNLVCKER